VDVGFGGDGYRKSGGLTRRRWGEPSSTQQFKKAEGEGTHVKCIKRWWRQRAIPRVVIQLARPIRVVLHLFECLDKSQMVLDALPGCTRLFKRVFDPIELDLRILEDVGRASLAWDVEVSRESGVWTIEEILASTVGRMGTVVGSASGAPS
jgi:hypothetical protein